MTYFFFAMSNLGLRMNIKVSVIIPTYNRAKDLIRAIDSVVNQTYKDWEVIVVDNHSSDETDAVINQLNNPKITLVKINNNGIVAASRNLGIKHARGDYIAFLDSDDWWMPKKLEESCRALDEGADLVYHQLIVKKAKGLSIRRTRSFKLQRPVLENLILNGNAISNSSVVVVKKLVDQVGGLSEDPGHVAMEDFDLWLRISRLTDNFVMLNRPLGYYWLGDSNMNSLERVIRNIHTFTKLYQNEISEINSRRRQDGLLWTNYSLGRANFSLGNFEEAKYFLSQVKFTKPGLFFKSKLMLLQVYFYDRGER